MAATEVSFTLNGRRHEVRLAAAGHGSPTADLLAADTRLVDHIRGDGQTPGTKVMCRGGMCGACVVSVRVPLPGGGLSAPRAVNSCLAPLYNCAGWEITTVEGIGDRRQGYHPTQSRLAQMNGTQCGYCSPGMVMSMYSLLESGATVTPQTVEQHMDGNLCRCTGYRPILDAFQTFAGDKSERTQQIIRDIEELAPCAKSGKDCCGKCTKEPAPRVLTTGDSRWQYPSTLAELCAAIKAVPQQSSYKLVRGNTGTGVFADAGLFDTYISVTQVAELAAISKTDDAMTLGAAVTLSEMIGELQLLASARHSRLLRTAGFKHFADMADHLQRVANTPVRNAASWAGNLMLKHDWPEFPSDVFLLLAAAGGRLTVADADGHTEQLTVEQLLQHDMTRKLLVSVTLPALDENKYVFRSFKITPRAVSAHAYVNAAFVLPLDSALTVVEKPTLLLGGISKDFVHATATETFLTGKALTDPAVVKGALQALQGEVNPTDDPALASVQYRQSLATTLLYKTILRQLGNRVPAAMRSGGDSLQRPLSSGTETYDTDKTLWPVNKAVVKLEATAQTSGEARYTADEPAAHGQLHAAYVQSTVAVGTMAILDPAPALRVPGVVAFIGAAEIPGVNNVCTSGDTVEELFSSGEILYYGQAIGLIVAETEAIARRAAPLVAVTYKQTRPPVLTIAEALRRRDGTDKQQLDAGDRPVRSRQELGCYGTPTDLTDLHTVTGELHMGGQYHHQMETQTALVVPRGDTEIDVHTATQNMRDVQHAVAQLTALQQHKINMSVRRLGGGFGSKLQHPSRVAGAAAIAALYLNRPVKLVLDMQTNMTLLGGRLPYLVQYQAGVDDMGRVETLQLKFTADRGCVPYAISADLAALTAPNVYDAEAWKILGDHVTTDTAPKTYCRAPGTVQGITGIERVLDHVAHELNMDPWKVRQANFFTKQTKFQRGENLTGDRDVFDKMVTEMFAEADIEARKAAIVQFNQANRWRKRGLAVTPVRWPLPLDGKYPALVSVFGDDGSVAVTTGGVEMGQGLNTKVAQVCAKVLGVPLELVSVKPNMNVVNPNGDATGGSLGSDKCSMATQKACEQLNERLAPYRADGKSWRAVVADADAAGVNLSSYAMQPPSADAYNIFALAAAEAELDVLTGEWRLNRADVYEDTGTSLSPYVDLGQVQGAFVMGAGLHSCELLSYDPQTGRQLTDSAWSYFVPSIKDIATDFRVKLMANSANPVGIFNSKATGEPPLCCTYVVLSAVTQAVLAARRDAALPQWPELHAPATVERVQTACQLTTDMLVIA